MSHHSLRHTVPTTTDRPDVLVVGAGPAGLATALSAARHGARVLVVERHRGTSIHPRASGISTRTMEILRSWGVADEVRAASAAVEVRVASATTLADPEYTLGPTGFPEPREALAVSPALPACCPQDRIEPILLAAVRRAGAEVRFDTELVDLQVGADAVHARVRDRATGEETAVRAAFVVGADGPRSTVRGAVGVGTERFDGLGPHIQLLFRADLSPATGSRRYGLYSVTHPDAAGLVIAFGEDRYGYARPCPPGEAASYDAARWTRLLRAATGIADLRPELLSTATFDLAAELATATRVGRAFLVGDAAHRMTPVGAVGLNTAVHDGHGLGWKLAWAARGLGGEALLESHVAERRAIGERNTHRSLRPGVVDPADGVAGDLGSRYRSAVIDREGTDGTLGPDLVAPDEAFARPGTRAPHVWVRVDGRRRSTLDLFDGHLTLLAGRDGGAWRRAAAAVSGDVPLTVHVAGDDLPDPGGRVARAYRLTDTAAVLVRPDGYVAWRADAAGDPVAALSAAVDTALGRGTAASARDAA